MIDERMQVTEIDPDDWSLGAAHAPVTILEYGDFECPHCGAAHPVLKELVSRRDTVRLVYRHFPVTSIHPHARAAAEAAEAAGLQRRFWEMHDLIYANQRHLETPDLIGYAAALDLDVGRFERDLLSHATLPEVKRDFRRGVEDGVNGTPTLFINGIRYDGPRTLEALLSATAAPAAVPRY